METEPPFVISAILSASHSSKALKMSWGTCRQKLERH
jgi:hypothetical protein